MVGYYYFKIITEFQWNYYWRLNLNMKNLKTLISKDIRICWIYIRSQVWAEQFFIFIIGYIYTCIYQYTSKNMLTILVMFYNLLKTKIFVHLFIRFNLPNFLKRIYLLVEQDEICSNSIILTMVEWLEIPVCLLPTINNTL